MDTEITQAPPLEGEMHQAEARNGTLHASSKGARQTITAPRHFATEGGLPTFPMETGWREFCDPESGECHREPLTLQDILFPTEDDIGVVTMPQSHLHDRWTRRLADIVEGHLQDQQWLIMHDVLIYRADRRVSPAAPDIAVIPGGSAPAEGNNSYFEGRDGPRPTFVVEITSKDARQVDLNSKPVYYAATGVKEYLIVDIQAKAAEDWRLLGYRLDDKNPYYQELTPDAEGGLTFETVDLRFVAVGRERIDVYDMTTGERLLATQEQKVRAEAEAAAKADAEHENEALQAEILRLRNQMGQA